MRLSSLAFIAASAALVSAVPVPVRLLITSSAEGSSPITGVRFGHAVPPLPIPEFEKLRDESAFHEGPIPVPAVQGVPPGPPGPPAPPYPPVPPSPPRRFRHHPGCRGMKAKAARFMRKFKLKALEISNAFRQAFGLPLIEIKYHYIPSHRKGEPVSDRIHVEGGVVTIRPIEPEVKTIHGLEAPPFHDGPQDDKVPHHMLHHHGHHHHWRHRHDRPFLARLHFSLMNLGRWEGRAVAFVIGCGIGVLLRMFWVLAVVTYRSVKGSRGHYAPLPTSVVEYVSDDETVSAQFPKAELPKYVYIIEEKVEESK